MKDEYSSLEYENRLDSFDIKYSHNLNTDGLDFSSLLSGTDIEIKKRKSRTTKNVSEESFARKKKISPNNKKLLRKNSREKKILTDQNSNLLDLVVKKLCDQEIEPNNSILDSKPFDSAWPQSSYPASLQNLKSFSVPTDKKHLIDFWQEFDNGEISSIPTIGTGKSDSIRRISTETLKDIITKQDSNKYLIIDCRFKYEYDGGHIKKAVNINNHKNLEILFKSHPNHILIFHCEYSSIRAPRMAKLLRNLDRAKNKYPTLTFPEIYILDGGYKKFYKEFPLLCDPMEYIKM